jgi:hypothetical protein
MLIDFAMEWGSTQLYECLCQNLMLEDRSMRVARRSGDISHKANGVLTLSHREGTFIRLEKKKESFGKSPTKMILPSLFLLCLFLPNFKLSLYFLQLFFHPFHTFQVMETLSMNAEL